MAHELELSAEVVRDVGHGAPSSSFEFFGLDTLGASHLVNHEWKQRIGNRPHASRPLPDELAMLTKLTGKGGQSTATSTAPLAKFFSFHASHATTFRPA